MVSLLCLIAIITNAVSNQSEFNTVSSGNPLRTYLMLICISVSLPNMMMKLVGPIWNKITPIKDRPTHIESYITFLISVFLSFAIILPLLSLNISLNPLTFSWIVTLSFTPICLVFWKLRTAAFPIPENFDANAKIQKDSDLDAPPINNSLAYLGAGAMSAAFFCIVIGLVLAIRGGINLSLIAVSIFFPLLIIYALLSPVFIFVGSKLWSRKNSEGLQYTYGAAISLLFILATSACRPNIEWTVEELLNQWSILLVYGIALVGFCAGGWTLKKLYKRHPAALQFA